MSIYLNTEEIEQFVQKGYVRINDAFSKEIAEKAVDILWNDIPFDRTDPSTWVEPVVRLGMYSQHPFIDSLNSEKMLSIFDQLVGKDRWMPCRSVGTFPVRFPSKKQPTDIGKHVDVSFPGNDPNNYFEWRANIKSKGRALLMLVLYSDVSAQDAPTVIYEGSHIDVARMLSNEGDNGLSFMEIAGRLPELPQRNEVWATGQAGTVYLCHPFLVHSAQAHKGSVPKFMAQPPLLLKGEYSLSDADEAASPVERAIRLGINES